MLSDATDAIRARAESLWPPIEASVPLSFPNETNDSAGNPLPPRDTSGQASPFVRIEVIWNGGGFMSIGDPGANRVRRQGHIWIYAFVPQGSGDSRAYKIAGEAAGMFEGAYFGAVVCEGMQPGGQVDSEDGSYYGQSASVPFYFDETA